MTFIALTWTTFVEGAVSIMQDRVDFIQIKSNAQGGLEAQSQISDKEILPLAYMDSWGLTVSMLCCDFIVVWRAWVLFQQERLWKIALVLSMIVNIGIQLADCILDDININVFTSNSSTILDWLSLVVSLVVNMLATGLISWKAWNHYHSMKAAAVYRKTRALNILLLLIESGAIYCTLQVLYTVVTLLNTYGPANNSVLFLAYQIIGVIFDLVSAWYPIAVVILINMRDSAVVETFHIHQTMEGSHRECSVLSTTVHPALEGLQSWNS
ncbi:hypothetical protein GYMLUDRAFT_50601 [Collybiopsis luxurians FD-317 M1]|uniref:Uncharacterized protein n=1 Tax=Collybiopsis luxurians FD-317 M1 TaxID=944289 RepID=A0A0D0BAP1_9AGAR|nr:hypothetical protein GYMLUDRAFT_50601 [Collybiopsis luxurians FD-317 M1]